MAPEYYFKEPRLQMTHSGRFLVRLVSYFSYGVLAAAMFIFLFSDVKLLQSAGAILVLFFLDRLFHFNKSERPLARFSSRHGNIRCYLSPRAYNALEQALERALISGSSFYLHLLAELVKRPEIRKALIRMDIRSDSLTSKLADYLKESSPEINQRKELLAKIEMLMILALNKALKSYGTSIEPKDLFSAVCDSKDVYIERLLVLFNIQAVDLEAALAFSSRPAFRLASFLPRQFRVRQRVMNRAWTARPTPTLDSHSSDLTALARAGKTGFLIGHEGEYQRLLDVLSRPGRPNALLIGDAGAGKDTIVNHLAFQIAHDRVPKPLFDKRLVELHISSLISGASSGELEARLKQLINEIMRAGNIALYIPDIHQLSKTAPKGEISAIDILLPFFRGSEISVIGATSPREYKQYIETNSDFSSAFEEIKVEELSEEEAVRYLVYQSLVLERTQKITISFGAVKQAVRLAHKYFRQTLLPGSAEDLLKEAVSRAIREDKKILNAEDIILAAEQRTNVPIHTATAGEVKKLLNLEAEIHKSLINQEEAVKAVSAALREYRSGLSRKGGPMAAFLFVGPTGVGKTETAKILARLQFGSEDFMIRFDMTEYRDKQSIIRFIGSPDGVISGALTSAILERPYSLILLDEFEKAHPDILNLFLQVFDDGRLTDGLGRVVNFDNTIIIATSNAHSILIKEEIEGGTAIKQIGEIIKKRLTEYFKPELINRFSKIVVFKNLSPEDIKAIARLRLNELAQVLLETQGIVLEIDESANSAVASLGYDPVFGARPLRGVISEQLRSVLAEKILKQELVRGSKVTLTYAGDQFQFLPIR